MEKQEPKKAWVTPELIVLVRSKPEEAVLVACKGGVIEGEPGHNFSTCEYEGCSDCNVWASS